MVVAAAERRQHDSQLRHSGHTAAEHKSGHCDSTTSRRIRCVGAARAHSHARRLRVAKLCRRFSESPSRPFCVGGTKRIQTPAFTAPFIGFSASAATVQPVHSRKSRYRPDRQWYVSAEGQTMATFAGPSSVRMGSSIDEPGRQPAVDSAAEPMHVVAIPRSFALATTEVTVAEFRRFLDANPDAKRGYQFPGAPTRMAEVLARFSPDDDGPAIAVTWYARPRCIATG